jgi:hypothetical protein
MGDKLIGQSLPKYLNTYRISDFTKGRGYRVSLGKYRFRSNGQVYMPLNIEKGLGARTLRKAAVEVLDGALNKSRDYALRMVLLKCA